MRATKVIIDRFEGNLVICEKTDRTMLSIERSKLPTGAREGDVLILEGGTIRVDPQETAKNKKAADDLINGLWKT
jgi:hypothetical protein